MSKVQQTLALQMANNALYPAANDTVFSDVGIDRFDLPRPEDKNKTTDLIRAIEANKDGVSLVYGIEPARDTVRISSGIPTASASPDNDSTHPFSKHSYRVFATTPQANDKVTASEWQTYGITTADILNDMAFRTFLTKGKKEFGIFNDTLCKEFGNDPDKLVGAMREHLEKNTGRFIPVEKEVFKAYQQYLNNSGYSPVKTFESDTSEMERVRIKERFIEKPDTAKSLFRYQTSISCKNGIDFGQINGNQILFELGNPSKDDARQVIRPGKEPDSDHFDPSAAAKRVLADGRKSDDGNTYRSITNVELRKAFRGDMSDDSLKFFSSGKSVPAPWDRASPSQSEWTQYAKDRIDKNEAKGVLNAEEASKLRKHLEKEHGREEFRAINYKINCCKEQPLDPDAPHARVFRQIHQTLQRLDIHGVDTEGKREQLAAALTVKSLENGIAAPIVAAGNIKDSGTVFLMAPDKDPHTQKSIGMSINDCDPIGKSLIAMRKQDSILQAQQQPHQSQQEHAQTDMTGPKPHSKH